ncbi:ATP-dependent DNA helicase [Catelliglobosispora koreensis]|uniref:ATP-dependent DNA helicase n=1 Tax=Catelliglobosispora koreensis TaxID=129052 RepID=UPI000361601B|nr:ATP-dependent DNA helicase [Catelliglobosispora koreensis]
MPDALELLAAAVASVSGGDTRPGQQAMAAAIADAVEAREHLLVQAGTGTGKSLAYLAPALTVDGPVVISTATLALQSQLVEKDLPRLSAAVKPLLGREPVYALLKGRHHYLCLAKMEHADEEDPQDALFERTKWLGEAGKLGKQIVRIREWADKTLTGDRDELDPGVDDTAWRAVSTPARECVGATRCPYGPDCFAELSRARAREADIVVTNHSLLSVDMLAGRHIVPPHKLLVIDEAHELADRVSSAAQAELTPSAMDATARAARPFVEPELFLSLQESADALTVGLADIQPGRLTEGLPPGLLEACTLIDAGTRQALTAIGEVKADDPDPVRKQQARALLDDASKTAQRLLADSAQDVAWVDAEPRRALVVAPLSVAGLLREKLYDERTVIATSATLALGGKFDTIAQALGQTDGYRTLDVGSPFDYQKQGILYVAAHLPRPTTSGLSDAAGKELLTLINALGGRTLGLFSSRRAAQQAADLVRAQTDLTVLLQGDETLPILVRKFREDRNSCLFGVMSLWQGVDVPGDACQLVVIDRLPFPRPDEPLAAARSAAVDASGGSGFAAVSVPIAAIRLAQGVGRLIRSTNDRGVVAVLDSRLESARGYGSFLRASLPPFWYTTKPEVVQGALKRLAAT